MNARLFPVAATLVVTMTLAGCAIAPTAAADRPTVVGNWQLMAVETLRQNGEVSTAWMGTKPTGLITYQANGLMSVQIMRDPKPTFAGGSRLTATPEELKQAYSGYYAYWGRYSVEGADQSVTHQLTASLLPEEVGVTYKRFFSIDGRRLVLTTPPFNYGGQVLVNRLTWERMP